MKNKFNYLLMGALLCSFGFVVSCSSSDDSSDNGGGGGNATPSNIVPTTPVNPANMQMSALSGFVFDKDGKGLAGVTVKSGTASVTTDVDGGFVFNSVNAVNGRTVVRFSKAGYIDVVRSAKKEDGDAWEVVMAKANDNSSDKFTTQESFAPSTGANLDVQGMKVDLEADGFVNESTGQAPNGNINVDMVYLDPGNDDFSDLMPGGDLAAEQVNQETGQTEEVQLISYGMTAVNMTENGDKIQLKGKKAKVTFPVPESMANDKHIGDPIPLWSFDEEKGVWVEEGMATYNSDKNVYEGEVSHFSWANLDYPEKRATIKVTVVDDTDAHNPIPNVKVTIGQVTKTTKKDGKAETYVPINTAFTVTVRSEDYANYTNIKKVDIEEDELNAGDVKEITIELQTLAHLSGTIVNEGEGSKVATVWVEYNGKSTKKVHSDINGQFYMNAPADYTGPATLKVRSADGTEYSQDITLTGKDQAFRLVIKNDVASGGAIKAILNNDGNEYNYTIENLKLEDFQGVCLVDGVLEIMPSHGAKNDEDFENGWNTLYLYIDNYKASVSDYENINFSFDHEGAGGYFSISTGYNDNTKMNTVNVTRKGDAFRFKLSGDAFIYGEDIPSSNQPNGTMEADFTISYLMTAVSKTSFDANDFPSFTPTLSGQTLVYTSVITDSPVMGKGGYLSYGSSEITFNDFLSLKAKADAYFGNDNILPTSEFDANDENMYDTHRVLYAKDNKYLEISYCSWSSWTDRSNYKASRSNFFMSWNPEGRIDIRAYEGLKIPYTTFSDALQFRVKGDRANMPWQTRR